MQAASATLIAAIQSKERQPVQVVKADWSRDGTYVCYPGTYSDVYNDVYSGVGDIATLTGWVESVAPSRSLSTDLPEGAKVNTGFSAADATVVLAGATGGVRLSKVFGAYANPLSTFAPRIGAPVTIDLGFRTTAGVEVLRQFTGKVRACAVDPATGAVTLSCIDNREKVRTPVVLPVRAGTDPGLNAGDFIALIVAAQPGITSAYETSLNNLTATPAVDTSDPWELLQQIAAAEQGIITFTEDGVLHFYNRDHLTGGAAVATITTDPSVSFANLIQAASEEAVDTVANYINVGAVPLTLDPPSTTLWILAEIIGVPARASIAIPVDFPGPLYTITNTAYKAAQLVDGTGGDVSNLNITAYQVSSTTWNIVVANPNSFDVFMVGNSTTPGQEGDPYFLILGRCIRVAGDGGYAAVRVDPLSQARYGPQTLDVPANVWRQSTVSAGELADHLLDALKDPHPTLGAVQIVADPRLQLGDRVRVADPDGLVLDGDFWLVAIGSTFDTGSGYTQSVTLRAV